jgi:GNAT superfamily N-acetyltransferase
MNEMKYEERNVSLEEYQWLRRSVGWWDTEPVSTKEGLENSLYSVAVVENEKVIAIGRVIGDKGLYFYIQDLIVHPDFQGKGIGRKIMSMLKGYIEKNAKPGAFIGLMAAKGLEAYYEEFGFQPRPVEGPGMFYIKQ